VESSRSLWLGAVLITLAFFSNTTQSVFGKYVEPVASAQLFTFGSFLIALVLVFLFVLFRGFKDLPTQKITLHSVRAVTGIAGFALFMAASQLTSLHVANVLVNTTPIFIPIIALIFLKERIAWQVWSAIAIGFVGVVAVVQPSAAMLANPGALLALAAGFVTAIEFIAVHYLDETESPITQIFYFLLIGTALSGLLSIGHFQLLPLWALLMMAVTGALLVLFQFLLIKAYLYAKPYEIGAFQYTAILFAMVYGLVLFGEKIDLLTIVGAALICFGGIVSITGRRQPDASDAELRPAQV
jgi:drug/metabolite transporter (DMT)-like permease